MPASALQNDSENSPASREASFEVLEREAEEARRGVAALEKAATAPINLPTPDEMLQIVFVSSVASWQT